MDHHAVSNEIRDKLARLDEKRRNLEREMNERTRELDQVKSDTFGVGKRIRDIVAKQIIRINPDIQTSVGNRVYDFAREKEIENAQDYIDYVKDTISKMREEISRVNDVIANLQNQQRVLASELNALNTWLSKADEIINT